MFASFFLNLLKIKHSFYNIDLKQNLRRMNTQVLINRLIRTANMRKRSNLGNERKFN